MSDSKEQKTDNKGQKTKFYKVVYKEVKEKNGKKLSQNPSISENGGVYTSGMVIELTPERMKQLGADNFTELTDKEFKQWDEAGRKVMFRS